MSHVCHRYHCGKVELSNPMSTELWRLSILRATSAVAGPLQRWQALTLLKLFAHFQYVLVGTRVRIHDPATFLRVGVILAAHSSTSTDIVSPRLTYHSLVYISYTGTASYFTTITRRTVLLYVRASFHVFMFSQVHTFISDQLLCISSSVR